jgi:hypothetical protein
MPQVRLDLPQFAQVLGSPIGAPARLQIEIVAGLGAYSAAAGSEALGSAK